MFSVRQKKEIADAIQTILRETNHPELPEGEIEFQLHVNGKENWSWADIKNNGSVSNPTINIHNEIFDRVVKDTYRGCCEECGEGFDNEEEWKYNTECEVCGEPIPEDKIIKKDLVD
jgi:hypothetical protein